MHTNLKVQELIERSGAEGYALWCLCLEMVGKEGKAGRIDGRKRWQKGIKKVFQWSDEGKVERIINVIAEIGLISSKALKYGNLYIPEYRKRADNWTKRQLRSDYGEGSLRIEENRIDKNIIDKILEVYMKEKGWEKEVKENPSLLSEMYKRNGKAIKQLWLAVDKKTDLACKAIRTLGAWFREIKRDWTLETVLKHLPRGLKPTCKYCKGKGRYVSDTGYEVKCDCQGGK